jgi:hypothetical protein
VWVNPGFSQGDLGGWGIRRSPERREMMKSVCASGIRNIRYIVDGQGFKVQQKALHGCNIRYTLDAQVLRYDHFLAAERQQ